MGPEFSFRIAPNWPKIGKMTMTSQFADITSSSNFFGINLFFLSSLVIGPSFMSISSLVLELWQFTFIKDWPETRKSEIPVWVLPNICRLGWVRDTKFSKDVRNEMLLNAAKCQGYSFYRFWVINDFAAGVMGGPVSPPYGTQGQSPWKL